MSVKPEGDKMSSMDLEKLKMTGAGRAMAVLTSGGDAQGDCKNRKTDKVALNLNQSGQLE